MRSCRACRNQGRVLLAIPHTHKHRKSSWGGMAVGLAYWAEVLFFVVHFEVLFFVVHFDFEFFYDFVLFFIIFYFNVIFSICVFIVLFTCVF